MSANSNEPQPDLEEIQQQEADERPTPPIPVTVEGNVKTLSLPTRTASMRSISVTDTEVIAGEDKRRASVMLYGLSGGAPFVIGPDRQMVMSGQAAQFDSGITVKLRTTERLYARSLGESSLLTIVIEQWAD